MSPVYIAAQNGNLDAPCTLIYADCTASDTYTVMILRLGCMISEELQGFLVCSRICVLIVKYAHPAATSRVPRTKCGCRASSAEC